MGNSSTSAKGNLSRPFILIQYNIGGGGGEQTGERGGCLRAEQKEEDGLRTTEHSLIYQHAITTSYQ